jgi:hypothetical protein
MIKGHLILEDIRIKFQQNKDQSVTFEVSDMTDPSIKKRKRVSGPDFFGALSIAIHYDGMPDYRKDYPAAEMIQSLDRRLRFIP